MSADFPGQNEEEAEHADVGGFVRGIAEFAVVGLGGELGDVKVAFVQSKGAGVIWQREAELARGWSGPGMEGRVGGSRGRVS